MVHFTWILSNSDKKIILNSIASEGIGNVPFFKTPTLFSQFVLLGFRSFLEKLT